MWRDKLTIGSMIMLNALKEAFFMIMAPFLPGLMDKKDISDSAYIPIFV